MNSQLIDNWNSVVRPDDLVYHLGDFAFLPPKQTREVLDCLNGNIVVVLGNHDMPQNLVHDRVLVKQSYKLILEDAVMVMSHYPDMAAKLVEDEDQLGFCGHIHTQWRSWQRPDGKLIYNLGVDVWDYHPVNLEDIVNDMNSPINRVVGEWKDAYHD